MHELLKVTAHRPWPLPSSPWIMRQTWHNLLFAHWPVAVEALAAKVPAALPLDLYDGKAWLAVAPFHMSGIRMRGLPPVPGASAFPELNVRTYVTCGGKPGVYFFSLDAASRLAVAAARLLYKLPYFFAEMKVTGDGERVHYSSRRRAGSADFKARYAPVKPVELRSKGSLEHFLTERYCLYTAPRGQIWRAEIHHQPWPLQDAEAEIETNTMAAAAGIQLPQTGPLLHFSRRLDVLIWPLRQVRQAKA